ncbi:helix-turn-helix domain-containing protein [Lentzea sp. PSKA42]|uniref:Helix-turn-helix domain-containing protein n=1 Tax=Lentzea indica TaxID=2604800 RepID=A0ABX1FX10_9PSEU|nr:helix-turn-helix domain-containing protein [Lentzea indica]NKE63602.1 helix-turn-helix domain-containing protein [Lentzea indica]
MHTVEVERLAAFLRMFKNRTERSYESLANRTGVSSSSLHRYCTGTKIPTDFGSIQRFAKECGATQEELRELHRLWVLADAVRRGQPEPADPAPADSPPAAGPPAQEPPRSRFLRRRLAVIGATALVLVAGGMTVLLVSAGRQAGPPAVDGPMLLSSACPPVVSMGQHDECVREVQTLLSRAGAKIEIDGDFGPATLRRVTAFQVLADLQPRGVVDEATKRALYDRKVSMAGWSPEQVERRIREVFPEEPDRAVGIARCQSFLDPLHVLTNTNGTRNWGVFQLSDRLLAELGGTQRQAYDPEWNIQTARRAWSRHRDFRDWEHCDQPFRTSSPPPSSSG